MSVEFKNSETKGNLMRAFAGESQARNRYTFSGKQARKQEYYVIEQIFNFTADQEYAHAKLFYEHLRPFMGETITVDGGYPVDLQEDYCGYVHEGTEAPKECPNCHHGQGFFVRLTLAPYTKASDDK
ncbi:rubrerythrin family protein [Lachnoclostridium phytofermentans]|uniref:Rubrerythrin n=1 Tax=Lachnoclostridium phytofermentans (strain ATCC 700394 / DSM 18823 / ISDg) TaxID=357809 RepID=A9KNX0_LACP7|nr:ferritin family protein [Lachnoclostridium phytofermentans]ABX43140.1 Rubrerythrin [Lachnoclostridium phytofermentans ISDg]